MKHPPTHVHFHKSRAAIKQYAIIRVISGYTTKTSSGFDDGYITTTGCSTGHHRSTKGLVNGNSWPLLGLVNLGTLELELAKPKVEPNFIMPMCLCAMRLINYFNYLFVYLFILIN
jgi:hypothetical protein